MAVVLRMEIEMFSEVVAEKVNCGESMSEKYCCRSIISVLFFSMVMFEIFLINVGGYSEMFTGSLMV